MDRPTRKNSEDDDNTAANGQGMWQDPDRWGETTYYRTSHYWVVWQVEEVEQEPWCPLCTYT